MLVLSPSCACARVRPIELCRVPLPLRSMTGTMSREGKGSSCCPSIKSVDPLSHICLIGCVHSPCHSLFGTSLAFLHDVFALMLIDLGPWCQSVPAAKVAIKQTWCRTHAKNDNDADSIGSKRVAHPRNSYMTSRCTVCRFILLQQSPIGGSSSSVPAAAWLCKLHTHGFVTSLASAVHVLRKVRSNLLL